MSLRTLHRPHQSILYLLTCSTSSTDPSHHLAESSRQPILRMTTERKGKQKSPELQRLHCIFEYNSLNESRSVFSNTYREYISEELAKGNCIGSESEVSRSRQVRLEGIGMSIGIRSGSNRGNSWEFPSTSFWCAFTLERAAPPVDLLISPFINGYFDLEYSTVSLLPCLLIRPPYSSLAALAMLWLFIIGRTHPLLPLFSISTYNIAEVAAG